MSGAAWLSRAPMVVRALITSALVAAAGAIAVTVSLPGADAAVSGGAMPTAPAPHASRGPLPPTSSASATPTPSASRDCRGLTLQARDPDDTVGDRIRCRPGHYPVDARGRAVLVATCPTARTWLADDMVLIAAESGVAVAPQCGPGGSPRRGEPQLPPCDALLVTVRSDVPTTERCWFDGRTSVAIDSTRLALVESSTNYVLANGSGRVVELAP
ncbi:MAG: hypothetical protein WAQ75_00610 [Propionicimonas sp.]